MLLSNTHNFILVSVSKTGTTSMIEALKKHIPTKSEDFDIRADDIVPHEKPGEAIRKHSSATELRDVLGEERFNSMFKFCFVRNPWDRQVSMYLFARRSPVPPPVTECGQPVHWHDHVIGATELSFCEYLRRFQNRLTPYIGDIADENGDVLVDFVGRFESMQADFDSALQTIGLPPISLPHLNRSERRDYVSYYDDECVGIVAHTHAREIELFQYSFGDQGGEDKG